MEELHEKLIHKQYKEGFVIDDSIAGDATHFEFRDQAPAKEDKPKKYGSKPKAECDKWLKEQAEKEAKLSIYEKEIDDHLDIILIELCSEVPQDPKRGMKKSSEGKNEFWFGYKGHLGVGTPSQFILQTFFSSGNLNDGKAAIHLLKGIHECLSKYQTMDAGYDHETIYIQVYRMGTNQ